MPKMGRYGNLVLPMTFKKFKTSDIILNTRKPGSCTIFDVSHMGVFETRNVDYLNKLLHLDLKKLKNNQSKLAVLLEGKNANMIVDDLIVSFINYHKYRLVVNTNTIDFFREKTCLKEQDKTILAIQGDYSQKLLEKITNRDLSSLYFMENKPIYKNELEICRCGYTGEDGFELYITGKDSKLSNDIIESLVDKSLNNKNIMFGGLIERDILRQEAGLWLAGNEFSRSYPIQFDGLNSKYLTDIKYRNNEHFYCESRLKYFCSDKPIKNVAIYCNSDIIRGVITSSNKSFTLNKFIGLGYLNNDQNFDSNSLYYKGNNGKKIPIIVSDKPFVKNKYYRKNMK